MGSDKKSNGAVHVMKPSTAPVGASRSSVSVSSSEHSNKRC